MCIEIHLAGFLSPEGACRYLGRILTLYWHLRKLERSAYIYHLVHVDSCLFLNISRVELEKPRKGVVLKTDVDTNKRMCVSECRLENASFFYSILVLSARCFEICKTVDLSRRNCVWNPALHHVI